MRNQAGIIGITRRAQPQLFARYTKPAYQTTGVFEGRPTVGSAVARCQSLPLLDGP